MKAYFILQQKLLEREKLFKLKFKLKLAFFTSKDKTLPSLKFEY